MELLAPVGSKESFITAIRAGADAVYIGVPDFNARVSAANINLYDIKVLIDYAHKVNVKVFLTLNILIKHEEINTVVKNIALLRELKADAVIVQDLGIAGIIRDFFPDIPMHASTQMAVHNRPGVDFLARQGFKRVIMARELSFSELKTITKGSPAEIEVFCHGAMCFSMSGMCLFSSYIGGLSGNRGRCTQPCRRLWENGKKRGYFFSPKDLEFAEHINKLKKIGIASVKIEGRMRSSEYVYRAVKAYRMLIDAPDADFALALKEARAILAGDAAREKTACLLFGRDTTIFQPQKAQCLGNSIGKIADISNGSITVEAIDDTVQIIQGDRLRLSNPETDTTLAFKIKEQPLKQGLNYIIPFDKTAGFARGNPVFKTIDAALDQKDIDKDIDAIFQDYAEHNRRQNNAEPQLSQEYTSLISNKWKEAKGLPRGEAEDCLWIRFDDLGWLDILPLAGKNVIYVFRLTKDNLHSSDNLQRKTAENLAVELPPFIGQRDLALFQQYIDDMTLGGIKKWVINNVSQFEFFKNTECELISGQFLYAWNAYAVAFLSNLGVKYSMASWEDDFLNIRKMCGPGLGKSLIVFLYGLAPLVRSRIITSDMLAWNSVKSGVSPDPERENKYEVFLTPVLESEQALLLPEKPLSLFKARKKLNECGIINFGVDLSYMKPGRKLWDSVFSAYQAQENIPDLPKFNFKRGIK